MKSDVFWNSKPDFEVADVEASTAQLVRNVEKFYNSVIIILDENGKLNYFNSRASELFELNPKVFGRDLHILQLIDHLAQRGDFGPGDPIQFAEIASKMFSSGTAGENQFEQTYLTMPSSNILRVLLSKNTDGTVTLSAQDVSCQRRNENMLEMALDIGLAGYLVFDLVQKCCTVESRYLSNLLTSEELHALETMGPSSLFHPDDLSRSQEMWESVRATGDTERGTLRFVTEKEGVRYLRFVLIPESDSAQSNRIIAFFNDVTDMLRQQENMRQAKSLAEESLSAKENFMARMSHEIRTPMNAVIGMTDALIHHHNDSAIAPQLELVQKSALSILKMLDETLTHSRLDTDSFSLDPAPASPAQVVRDVCALWEQQALKNNGVIRCIIKKNVPSTILFDKYRYEQCVNNLLSNAVKFTPGGTIEVILTVLEKPGQTPYLVLAVKDSGIGMTDEQQSRIFEAYTQADQSISSRYGGTGLGMNITKQIVDRMGGTISVRSKIGSGSMFAMSVPITTADADVEIRSSAVSEQTLTPPLHENVAVPAPSQPDPIEVESETLETPNENELLIAPQPHEIATSTTLVETMLDNAQPEATAYSDLRVLVVDDNPTNHLVIKSLLGSVVANISLASNGTEALDILDSEPVDIVLMDIHMPVMDGIECTLAIRSSESSWKDVIIIALTADPQYQQTKLCKNIGMDEALAKPVRLNDLLQAIDTVLSKPRAEDPVDSTLSHLKSA